MRKLKIPMHMKATGESGKVHFKRLAYKGDTYSLCGHSCGYGSTDTDASVNCKSCIKKFKL